jgi:hypothetical protein
MSQELRTSRRQVLQARCDFWNEARTSGRRQGHFIGDSQRRLWKLCILSHAGEQGLPTSFLLSYNSVRCRRTRQKVPKVSILRQAATRPSLQASHDTADLALCLLGA